MPIHDWTRVQAGLFHEFHQSWTVRIKDALNGGNLPQGFCALLEQRVDGTASRIPSDAARYARRANIISVRHPLGDVVAMIEIVSPGNKDSRNSLRSFVRKAADFLRTGVHLLVVDLFPPSDRDPEGIHKAIWDEFSDERFKLPAGKPLTLVGYQAGSEFHAYIEPVAVGDTMPDMPLFLAPGEHILVPLESTYQTTWAVCPEPIRRLVESP